MQDKPIETLYGTAGLKGVERPNERYTRRKANMAISSNCFTFSA